MPMSRAFPQGICALLSLSVFAFGVAACSSSDSPSSTPIDAGALDSAADHAVADAAPTGDGLTISKATVASLDGTYAIQVFRADVATGIAYNGNFDEKIEIEVDTTTAGVVKVAHVWNYTGTGASAAPDKFYGCDGQAVPCTGVTVDVATNTITLASPTWHEVESPRFDGSKPDVAVAGGGSVTVSGTIHAKAQ